MWLATWYRESYKAKREAELATAKEQGRREGRAELQAELEAAHAELDDEPSTDSGAAIIRTNNCLSFTSRKPMF